MILIEVWSGSCLVSVPISSVCVCVCVCIYIYMGLSTLVKEFMPATCIMQSSSNKLSTLVSSKI